MQYENPLRLLRLRSHNPKMFTEELDFDSKPLHYSPSVPIRIDVEWFIMTGRQWSGSTAVAGELAYSAAKGLPQNQQVSVPCAVELYRG